MLAVLLGFAFREVSESRAHARVAESRALAGTAIALGAEAPEAALLLGIEAFRLVHDETAEESYEARNSLVHNVERFAAVRAILRGHEGAVLEVTFSPDGRTLASGGEDGTVRLWDARRHVPIGVLYGHRGHVTALAWSPDGATLASAGRGSLIRLWEVKKLALAGVLRGHVGDVRLLQFAPDGRQLVSAGDVWSGGGDFTVRVWDVESRRQIGRTIGVGAVGARFVDDGRTLQLVNMVGWITHHDGREPEPYQEPSYDTGYTEYYEASFLSGGLLALDGEGGVELLRVHGTRSRPLPRGESDFALTDRTVRLVGGAEGRFATAEPDGTVTIWGPDDPVLIPFRNQGTIDLDFDAGSKVAAAGADGTIRLGHAGAQSPLVRSVGKNRPLGNPPGFVYSQDRKLIAEIVSFGEDSFSLIVRAAGTSGARVGGTFTGRTVLPAFRPGRRELALVARDGRVRFWDVDRTEQVGEALPPSFPSEGASALAFSGDGKIIAAISEFDAFDAFVLWDVARRAPLGDPVPASLPSSSYFDEDVDGPLSYTSLLFDADRDGFVYLDQPEDEPPTGLALDPLLTSSNLEHWRTRVCKLVGRNLTKEEWRLYVPGRAYRRTCPGVLNRP